MRPEFWVLLSWPKSHLSTMFLWNLICSFCIMLLYCLWHLWDTHSTCWWGTPFLLSDIFPLPVTIFSISGRNEPLKKERPKWKSDYPMTEGQLRSKRDEFWDTAPAFEGRKEIWDALKAAAVALECSDHDLAQAIVDGASITLPHGGNGKKYNGSYTCLGGGLIDTVS